MEIVKLQWASAEVNDAVLTVPLEGDVPKGWKRSFERTVQLLGAGEWGEVSLKKGAVKVSDVAPGAEEKLRHHLESVVTQANAAHEAQEQAETPDDEDPGRGDDEQPSSPDAEMTDQFRSFADDRAD